MKSKIWAHRGLNQQYPENTIKAIQAAIDLGVDGIEIDVQRTKDGKIIICHDENLSRLAGTDKMIYELSSKELETLRIYTPDFSEEHEAIPTLEEVLEVIKSTNVALNIEFKNSIYLYPGMENQVIELVSDFGLEKQIYYSSFNHKSMAYIASLGLGERCGILYSDILHNPIEYTTNMKVKNLHPALNSFQLPHFVELARDNGVKIHVWTVNTDEHLQFALARKADAIITDQPARAIELREKLFHN